MIIPHERLAPETLNSLIESVIHREGTDYGSSEYSLATKIDQVKRQIFSSEIVIVFDNQTDSINLLPRQDVSKAWELQA